MRIETERLILQKFKAGDEEALYACLSDAEVVKWEPYAPMTQAQAADALQARMATPSGKTHIFTAN